jgi:replicative DNA helicase
MSDFNPRIPPNSNESEQSVLGGLLTHNEKFDDVITILGVDDFYDNKHKLIFSAIAFLIEHGEAADTNTTLVQLEKNNASETVGGLAYLLLIVENTPSIDNIVNYSRHVRELSVYRSLIKSSNEIADLAYSPKDMQIADILDAAETKIFAIAESLEKQNTTLASSKDILPVVVKDIEKRAEKQGIYGLETGFYDLDKLTNGLQRSDLIIIAGRPSMGKTSFAMNIVEHASIHNHTPCLVFSLEMPKEHLMMRMIASSFEINMAQMRDGSMNANQWGNFNNAIDELSNVNVIIDDSPAPTPNEIRATARRVKRANPDLGLIVVDYIGMVRVMGAKDRNSEIGEISRSLKALAKEIDVPLIALSQLNRNVENKTPQNKGRMPQMSDLRDSGTLEQDADIIAFVYRDERYHGEAGYQNPDEIGKADIKIAKHRNGATGMIKLGFDGQFTKFKNLDDRDMSEGELNRLHESSADHMQNIADEFKYSQSVDPSEINEDEDRSPF